MIFATPARATKWSRAEVMRCCPSRTIRLMRNNAIPRELPRSQGAGAALVIIPRIAALLGSGSFGHAGRAASPGSVLAPLSAPPTLRILASQQNQCIRPPSLQ